MTMGNGEYQFRTMFLDHLNLQMVMDHARVDPIFMAQLIEQLESRGVDDRTDEEKSLLEWARSTQLQLRKK